MRCHLSLSLSSIPFVFLVSHTLNVSLSHTHNVWILSQSLYKISLSSSFSHTHSSLSLSFSRMAQLILAPNGTLMCLHRCSSHLHTLHWTLSHQTTTLKLTHTHFEFNLTLSLSLSLSLSHTYALTILWSHSHKLSSSLSSFHICVRLSCSNTW